MARWVTVGENRRMVLEARPLRSDVGDARGTALLADCGARVDCLGRTNAGHPRHPLYVHAAQAAEPYLIRGAA